MARTLIRFDLGFLGPCGFARENPRSGLLDFLGFPWIPSSESRLINGLRGMFAHRIFRAPFPLSGERRRGGAPVRAMRKRGNVHEISLTLFLVTSKQFVLGMPPGRRAAPRFGRSAEGQRPILRRDAE